MAKQDLTTELGASGVYITGGVISGEEYNRDLIGRRGLTAYDQMSRNDATVNEALDAVKQPILNADFGVDPASEDDADVEVAAFVKACLIDGIGWDKFLDEALTFQEFGFSVFEKVYEPRVIDGVLRQALVKLGYRKQTTILYWETADKKPGIQQQLLTSPSVSIPMEKLVVFTRKQRGDNYEGISILRTAYKHWKLKDTYYKIDAVGQENHSLGILDITQPKGASEADKAKMTEFAMNRRANALSHIIKPEGWIAEFMDMKSGTLRDIMPSINHHDKKILANALAGFLDFGSSGAAGSRSTSEDHSKLFELSIKRVADQIVDVLQQHVVKQLVDLNFTGRPYPILRVSNISDDNIPVLSEAFTKLVAAGFLHPGPDDENVVRKMTGLPEVEKDELGERFNTAKPVTTKDDGTDPVKKAAAVLSQAKQLKASIEGLLYDGQNEAA